MDIRMVLQVRRDVVHKRGEQCDHPLFLQTAVADVEQWRQQLCQHCQRGHAVLGDRSYSATVCNTHYFTDELSSVYASVWLLV